ncbi:carbamate kinase [candidate division WOR-3 bacterium]|uniref:Carbamate kinase n=1 Tax=candidate division WOR-3 bacterium TaxID=2052148 RepID=A0A9D5K9S2_UNCW3|nr:carbamate kinase [candidate division WOR-3 bacterium]MBD3365047.1 carbamate kinase [candidate division WOR-3 bacterium]
MGNTAQDAGKTAVIALGGNALMRKDVKFASFAQQRSVVEKSARQIARLIDEGWRVAITHGNGPQVGNLLLISHMAHERNREIPEIPLDAANANTQGSLGYLIAQAVRNASTDNGEYREIAAIVTQVVVDRNDPAFYNPTKFVGPAYGIEEANELSIRLGWKMKEDRGRGWRRVVASPDPLDIVEITTIHKLMKQGVSVVTVGGGGIPVVREGAYLKGVSSVIDKDRASALLATNLGVRLLAMITQVENVYLDFGKPAQRPVETMNIGDAKTYLDSGQFPQGSMGPKIESAVNFLEKGGKEVLITNPVNITEGFCGLKGTRIVP